MPLFVRVFVCYTFLMTATKTFLQKELTIIKNTDSFIDSSHELHHATNKILKDLLKRTRASRGAIIIFDPAREKLVTLSKEGLLDRTLITTCFKRGRVQIKNDNALALPVVLSKKPLGVIYLSGISKLEEKERLVRDVEAVLDGRFQYEHDLLDLKKGFSRFLGERVVDKILSKKSHQVLSGKHRDATVMFVDINGFTPFMNTRKPNDVIKLLNTFFKIVSEIVIKNGGVIDKFIGDEVMAVFKNKTQKEHVESALKSALLIRKSVTKTFTKYKLKNGGVSIGIATGRVISGSIGFEKMADYTVVGKKVNLASRLTSYAGKNEILADEATAGSCTTCSFKKLGKKDIRGFGKIPLFRITTR